jgi:hypothetical protein
MLRNESKLNSITRIDNVQSLVYLGGGWQPWVLGWPPCFPMMPAPVALLNMAMASSCLVLSHIFHSLGGIRS